MSEQVSFELKYNINGKDTVCGIRQMDDGDTKYYLLCATVGDYSREYELRPKPESSDCLYHFVTPDVPEELKDHECEISKVIVEHEG